MSVNSAFYGDLLTEVKRRIRHAQHRAAMAVNAELVRLYWDIGHMIDRRQQDEGWGAGVIPHLARDLHNELPELKGFSSRNINLMVQFYRCYPEAFPIVQRPVAQLETNEQAPEPGPATPVPSWREAKVQLPVAQIPWGHNVLLMQRVKDLPSRIWYAQQVIAHGWSRDTLGAMVKSRFHERQGAAVTNFAKRLPEPQSELAGEMLKDPYVFDFLTLETPFRERELETGLIHYLEKFLLELGQGFAFVGRQYPLSVGDEDFYLDLLFYHLKLRCFVVAELKRGKFKPEYAGKMNFYCSVVDDLLRHPSDQPTIGLILCQTKDRILAEYALRDIHKPIGVADYELTRALPVELASNLPSIEQIEAELQSEVANWAEDEGDGA
jgi:predicted nuclease of restriction endonuclease-like (RecB) superfamily